MRDGLQVHPEQFLGGVPQQVSKVLVEEHQAPRSYLRLGDPECCLLEQYPEAALALTDSRSRLVTPQALDHQHAICGGCDGKDHKDREGDASEDLNRCLQRQREHEPKHDQVDDQPQRVQCPEREACTLTLVRMPPGHADDPRGKDDRDAGPCAAATLNQLEHGGHEDRDCRRDGAEEQPRDGQQDRTRVEGDASLEGPGHQYDEDAVRANGKPGDHLPYPGPGQPTEDIQQVIDIDQRQ